MNEYEKLRDEKMKRNNAHLSKLGLLNSAERMRNEVTADKQKQKRTKKVRTKKVPKVKQEPTRR